MYSITSVDRRRQHEERAARISVKVPVRQTANDDDDVPTWSAASDEPTRTDKSFTDLTLSPLSLQHDSSSRTARMVVMPPTYIGGH